MLHKRVPNCQAVLRSVKFPADESKQLGEGDRGADPEGSRRGIVDLHRHGPLQGVKESDEGIIFCTVVLHVHATAQYEIGSRVLA